MNKKERMYQRIDQHGERLNKIFNTGIDNVTLCKKLLRLENKAHQLSTDYCNGDIDSCEVWEQLTEQVLKKVDKIINYIKLNVPVFVNGDARGYALKIRDNYIFKNNIDIYRDWGGYGIIAPDFRNEA